MANLKTYTGHYLMYGVGAIVAALTIAHNYGLAIPKYGPAIVAAAGVILGAIDQLRKIAQASQSLPSPAPAAVSKQSGGAYPLVLEILVVVAIGALVGCSTLQTVMSNPASSTAVEAAIDLGVGTYIQQTAKTPADQAARATQVAAVAQAIEAVATGDTATLSALDQVLQAKIDAANLAPPDKAAALLLAQTVQSVILQQINAPAAAATVITTPLTAGQVVALKAVLDDVIQAASFYGVHTQAVIASQASTN